MTANKEWFEDWFDSPYYHILYDNRNEQEAQDFINNLLEFLRPKTNSSMLDLACGKGRHSRYLAQKGYSVTGIDLSEQSILEAKRHEQRKLQFFVHDMRKLLYTNYFDFAFNFFTSFGYFEKETDNIKTLQAVNKGLKKGGVLVIDFLNVEFVKQNMETQRTLQKRDILFYTEKKISEGFIIKDIKFEHEGKAHHHREKVQALGLGDFKSYFSKSNFTIQQIFGNYALDDFDEQNSERLILIATKNA